MSNCGNHVNCVTSCRSEAEGRFYHSCSRRSGPDDRLHADEEHCDGGQKCSDALKLSNYEAAVVTE